MANPVWTFTEKNFYLAEFRGRSLAIALPGPELPPLEPLQTVLAELSANGTRTVLLSPSRALLERIAGPAVEREAEAGWLGRLWRGVQQRQLAALELDRQDFAAACSRAVLRLRPAKLIWIDPRGALQRLSGARLSVLDSRDLVRLLGAEVGTGEVALEPGDHHLLEEIRKVLDGGIPSVNICSLEGLADELFTYAGSGTFLTRERYAEVRQLCLDDLDAAADLIARGVEEGFLVARGEQDVEQVLAAGFGVFIEGRYLAGIGSLLPYAAEQGAAAHGTSAEIVSLYTLTRFVGEGIGGHLIRFALEAAREAGHRYVFACTTSEHVERFFERNGFRAADSAELPASKWRDYAPERREKLRCLRFDL